MALEALTVAINGSGTATAKLSEMILMRDIGSNQEGLDGGTGVGSPVDNGDYYSINGSTQGIYWSNALDESSVDGEIRFRLKERLQQHNNTALCLWKSGSTVAGIGVGITSNRCKICVVGRSSSAFSEIGLPQHLMRENHWYVFKWNQTSVYLYDETTGISYSHTGTLTTSNSGTDESMGYSRLSSPFTGIAASGDNAECDIDYIKLYTGGTLHIPTADVTSPNAPSVKMYFGGDRDGRAGFTNLSNAATDNDTYYTFNGTNNGFYLPDSSSDSFYAESQIEIEATIRIHDKDKGTAQIIVKHGSDINGIALGIGVTGSLAVFGRDPNLEWVAITTSNYSNNVWYKVRASRTKIEIQRVSDGVIVASNTGSSINAGNTGVTASVGYSSYYKFIAGTSGGAEYFDGDIADVTIWDNTYGGVNFSGSVVYEHEETDVSSSITFSQTVKVVTKVLDADVTASGTLTGSITGKRQFDAAVSGSATVAADLIIEGGLDADVTGSGLVTADLNRTAAVSTSITGSGLVTADLSRILKLSASVSASGLLAGNFINKNYLTASITGSGTLAGDPSIKYQINADITGSALVTALLAKSFTESVSNTITFTGDGTDSYKLVLPYLVDTLTFTSSVDLEADLTLSVSSDLDFTQSATGNWILNPSLLSVLNFNSFALGSKATDYVRLQAPFDSISASIILPNPLLDDSENLISNITLRKSMNNVMYTYVKSSSSRVLRYTFTLNRNKALELQNFFRDHHSNSIRMDNWKGETWKVKVKSNPLDFVKNTRYSPTGPRVDVSLEFEGDRVYA